MNIQFGSGVLFGKPVAGNLATNPTPFRFLVQEVTADFKADLKKLYTQFQMPIATARGKLDTTIKGKFVEYDPAMLNQLYFAQTEAAGYTLIVDGEAHTVNNVSNTATVTNTPVIDDWGVVDALTGQSFICMPNAAAVTVAGEYYPNVTTGVYTFSGADGAAARAVKISYSYTVSSTGATITLTNQLMGYAPELKMLLYSKFRNKYLAVQFNDVTLGSISIPTKLEDFWVSDFDGSANVDASNVLGQLMMDTY